MKTSPHPSHSSHDSHPGSGVENSVSSIQDAESSIQEPEPPPATFNFQPATPAEGLPTPQPKKRTGKIAELPKHHRDTINRLLEDGATYKTVATEMAKHGISLNGENISNWFDGGFQDYLKHRAWLGQIRTLHEDAGDLIDGAQILKFHQAANFLAVTQIFKSLKAEEFNDDPMNYTRILNAFSRLSRGALVFKQYEDACARLEAAQVTKLDPRRDLVQKERDLMWNCVQGVFGFKPDRQIGPRHM